jgi:hypothetical protein
VCAFFSWRFLRLGKVVGTGGAHFPLRMCVAGLALSKYLMVFQDVGGFFFVARTVSKPTHSENRLLSARVA